MIEQNPQNSLYNLRMVRDFIAEYRDDQAVSQVIREASELERKCEEKWQAESDIECDKTAEKVRELLKNKDYDGAHMAIESFSRKYIGSRGWNDLQEGRDTLVKVLENDMREAVKTAEEALAKRDFNGAVDVFMKFIERARFACDGRYRVEAERQIARVRNRIRELRAREGDDNEKADMEKATAAVKEARERMKGLRLKEARESLDSARKIYVRYGRKDEEIAIAPLYSDLKWMGNLLREIVRRSEAGMPPLDKLPMPGGEIFPVMAIDSDGVRVRDANDRPKVIPIEDVPHEQIQKILARCELKGDGRLGAAALWLHRGIPALADKELREAKRENPRLEDDREVRELSERVRKALGDS